MTNDTAAYKREYRAKNLEKVRAREQKYWSNHREKKREHDRKYYLENRERLIKKNNAYAQENKDRQKYCKQASFCRKKLKDDNMTADVVQMVYEDNIKKYGTLTCVVCKKKIEFGKDSLEHDIPLSKGGTHEYSNLGVSHRSCNSSKHTKTLKEMM